MKFKSVVFALLFLFSCRQEGNKKTLHEGVAEYKITYQEGVDKDIKGLLADGLTVKFNDKKMSLKFHGGFAEMKGAVIIDMGKQEADFINTIDSTILPKNLSSFDYGKDYKKKSKRGVIADYPTTEYEAHYSGNVYSISAAEDIPLNISNTLLLEGFYLSSFDALPLEVKVKESEMTYTIKAESIKAEHVPDSELELPKGFQVRRP